MSSTTQNARRENRFPTGGKQILLMRWSGEREYQSHRVKLLDCSAHGIGVQDVEPMQPGEQFVVYLHLDEVTMVLYTVRHCQKLDGGAYQIGAQLEGFITAHHSDPDEVLASLVAGRLA